MFPFKTDPTNVMADYLSGLEADVRVRLSGTHAGSVVG